MSHTHLDWQVDGSLHMTHCDRLRHTATRCNTLRNVAHSSRTVTMSHVTYAPRLAGGRVWRACDTLLMAAGDIGTCMRVCERQRLFLLHNSTDL